MRDLLDSLLACFVRTALPLTLAAAAATAVGVQLSSAVERWPRWLSLTAVGAHFAPLFLPPILVIVSVLTRLEALTSPVARQSAWTLGAFSYVFHVPIAYVLLHQVFGWPARRKLCGHQVANLPRAAWTSRAAVRLYWYGFPLAFCAAALFVFGESMVAAPVVLPNVKTVTSYAGDVFRHSTHESWTPLLLAVLLVATFLAILLPVEPLARASARGVLRSAAARRLAGLSSGTPIVAGRNAAHRWGFYWVRDSHFTTVVVVASALLQAGVVFIAVRHCWVGARGGNTERDTTYLDGLRLLGGPGVVNALIGGALFTAAVLLASWFRGHRAAEPPLGLLRRLVVWGTRAHHHLAFVPAALLGTVALVAVQGPATTEVFTRVLLIAYAAAFANATFGRGTMDRYRQTLQNARSAEVSRGRRLLVTLATPAGAVLIPWLTAVYLLWIEDGVQGRLVPDEPHISRFLRGLQFGSLDAGAYVIVLGAFVTWVGVFALALILERLRPRAIGWMANRALTPPRPRW